MSNSGMGAVAFRINAIPRTTQTKFRAQRRTDLDAVFRQAKTLDLADLILPGWTFVYSNAEVAAGAFRADMAWLKGATRRHGLRVLAEFSVTSVRTKGRSEFIGPPAPLGFMVFDRGKVASGQVRQVFATAAQVATPDGPYLELCRQIRGGNRILQFGRRRILVLVCGENNILRNVQSDRNRVEMRHAGLTLSELRQQPYDVAVNPAHTPIGNLGKMHKRWAALSKEPTGGKGRSAIFVTNGTRRRARSTLYHFKSGKKVPLTVRGWEGRRWMLQPLDL